LFETYARLPAVLRRGLIEPMANLPGLSNRFPLSKLKSYVTQANIGLPLRLESYNFLHRTPLDQIFAADFIRAVDPSTTDAALTEVYERTASDHYINRMMHLDLKFTLADNDLRKVGTMTEAAGIEAHYPLLDDRMMAFANHLPVDYKVRGQKLRWFFKEALTTCCRKRSSTRASTASACRSACGARNTPRWAIWSATACRTSRSAAGFSRRIWITCWPCSAGNMPVITG
jgi:asparagine synthase (glutamine-hydrolysing)